MPYSMCVHTLKYYNSIHTNRSQPGLSYHCSWLYPRSSELHWHFGRRCELYYWLFYNKSNIKQIIFVVSFIIKPCEPLHQNTNKVRGEGICDKEYSSSVRGKIHSYTGNLPLPKTWQLFSPTYGLFGGLMGCTDLTWGHSIVLKCWICKAGVFSFTTVDGVSRAVYSDLQDLRAE